jgi:hypothetical protein
MIIVDLPRRSHLGLNGLADDFDVFGAVGVDRAQLSTGLGDFSLGLCYSFR